MRRIYLIAIQVIVLGLPAIVGWQASRLGFDVAAILSGFGLVSIYLGAVGWILWGKDGSDRLEKKGRRVLVRVLTNLPALTILSTALIALSLYLLAVQGRFNLDDDQRQALESYSASVFEVTKRLDANSAASIERVHGLYAQARALMRDPQSFSSESTLTEVSRKFRELTASIRGYSVILRYIAMEHPKSWATHRQPPVQVRIDISKAIDENNANVKKLLALLGVESRAIDAPLPVLTMDSGLAVLTSRNQRELSFYLVSAQINLLEQMAEKIAQYFEILQLIVQQLEMVIGHEIDLEHLEQSVAALERLQLAERRNDASRFLTEVISYNKNVSETLDLLQRASRQMEALLSGSSSTTLVMDKFSERAKRL